MNLAEYLKTSYRPDLEFVNGVLKGRNMGTTDHAFIQAWLAAWLMSNRETFGYFPLTECRIQVTTNEVRIPDLILIAPGPTPQVPVNPPRLVIEILSPDDSYTETTRRCADYLKMGVPCIWLIDPATRTGRVYSDTTWAESSAELAVPETIITVDLHRMFDALERATR